MATHYLVPQIVGAASVPVPLVNSSTEGAGLRYWRRFTTPADADAFIAANSGTFILPGTLAVTEVVADE